MLVSKESAAATFGLIFIVLNNSLVSIFGMHAMVFDASL